MNTSIRSERRAKRREQKRQRAVAFHVQAEAFADTLGKAGGVSGDGRVFVACRKVKYPWHSTAKAAARAMQTKKNALFGAYWCRRCRAWHIGNARPVER